MKTKQLTFLITMILSMVCFTGNSFSFDLGGALKSLNKVAEELNSLDKGSKSKQNCREVIDDMGDSETVCTPIESQKGLKQPKEQKPIQQHAKPQQKVIGKTDTVQTAVDAYVRKDFKTAFKILNELAKQGNPDAQMTLGTFYAVGEGVEGMTEIERLRSAQKLLLASTSKHGGNIKVQKLLRQVVNRVNQLVPIEKAKQQRLAAEKAEKEKQQRLAAEKAEKERLAAEKLKKEILAAEQGDMTAQILLGGYYYQGQGVPQDYKEAVKWWKLAAEQGNAIAQYNLGGLYDNGQGVPQDYKEAVKWWRLSAEQGYAGAQSNIGSVYFYGKGVPQDYKEAVKWYRLAAAKGSKTAQKNLDVAMGEVKKLERAEAEKLKAEAEKLKQVKLAAEQGDKQAQFNLGVYYYKGKGVPQDYEEAVKWYRLAAEQDNTNAMNSLGETYLQGKGVPQDNVVALMWFNLCSKWNKLCMENENLVKKKMTPSQIEKALAATKVEQKRLSEQKRLANERAKQKRLANEKAFQQRQKEKHNLAIKLQAAGNACIESISEPHYKRSAKDIRRQLFKITKQINNTGRYTGSDLDGYMIDHYRQIISIGSNDRSANCHE